MKTALGTLLLLIGVGCILYGVWLLGPIIIGLLCLFCGAGFATLAVMVLVDSDAPKKQAMQG